jgi:hypothetical protein
MKVTVTLRASPDAIIAEKVLNPRVLQGYAEKAREFMEPYTPYRTGALDNSGKAYVEDGHGVVEYDVPYAARHYYGVGGNLRKEFHPLATAFWDQAMMASKSSELADAVRELIGE